MPHTVTSPGGHCPTVSAWIIRTDLGPEPRLLVHLHKRYGILVQPGGHVEPDEHAWKACLREMREEAGYEPDQLAVLQPFLMPEQPASNVLTPTPLLQNCHLVDPDRGTRHWDTVFAIVADGPPRHAPAEGESEDLRWMTVAELAADPAATPDGPVIARHAIDELSTWHRVPAVTFPGG